MSTTRDTCDNLEEFREFVLEREEELQGAIDKGVPGDDKFEMILEWAREDDSDE